MILSERALSKFNSFFKCTFEMVEHLNAIEV